MNEERALRLLSLLVAVLTLMTLWESHKLHAMQLDEACDKKRRRRQASSWPAGNPGGAMMN